MSPASVIFDTDVLIWLFRGDPSAQKLIDSIEDRSASIITLMEMLQGVRSKAELRIIRQFFFDLQIRVIPVSEQVSYVAAALIEDHALSDGLGIADALIAATARETGETLATGNVRHFRPISNLALKPFRPSGS